MVTDILTAIDNTLRDWSIGPDAMRWSPDGDMDVDLPDAAPWIPDDHAPARVSFAPVGTNPLDTDEWHDTDYVADVEPVLITETLSSDTWTVDVEAGATYEFSADLRFKPAWTFATITVNGVDETAHYRRIAERNRRAWQWRPRPLPIDGAAYRRRRNRRTK